MDRFDDIHKEDGSRDIRRDAHIRIEFDADGRRKDYILSGKVISIAADVGASTGRVMLGFFDGRTISVEEVHRFAAPEMTSGSVPYW